MGILSDNLEDFWNRFVWKMKALSRFSLFDNLLTPGENAVINMLFEKGSTLVDKYQLYVWLLRRKSFKSFFSIFNVIRSLKRIYKMIEVGMSLLDKNCK